MYIYGIHLWGCAWDKTVLELMDSPPKQACVALPVVHLTCCQITDKANQQDPSKAAEIYSCPVYASRISAREPIFEMDVKKEGISSYRWSLRGLSATIRNY
jgi:dynein heavy chain